MEQYEVDLRDRQAAIIAELQKPLDGKRIKSRKQGGQSLSYVEGHDVIETANRIFGFFDCSIESNDFNLVQTEQKDDKWYVGYTCLVTLNAYYKGGPCSVRHGVGFGQGIDRDLGRAHESAIKEAETDAMKRAFRTFGNQFGLSLYSKDAPEPVKAKTYELTPEMAAEAKEFLATLALTKEQQSAFMNASGAKNRWGHVALLAKKYGITTVDDLIATARKAEI